MRYTRVQPVEQAFILWMMRFTGLSPECHQSLQLIHWILRASVISNIIVNADMLHGWCCNSLCSLWFFLRIVHGCGGVKYVHNFLLFYKYYFLLIVWIKYCSKKFQIFHIPSSKFYANSVVWVAFRIMPQGHSLNTIVASVWHHIVPCQILCIIHKI